MEEELRALLLANSGVSALVSSRIAWGERIQGTAVPDILLTVISRPRDYHMTGASNPAEYRVQADCYGKTYASAKTVSRAVDALLSGYSGGNFQAVFTGGERDLRSAGSNDADRLFGVSLDYLIHFTE
jgi:hypothetical protein